MSWLFPCFDTGSAEEKQRITTGPNSLVNFNRTQGTAAQRPELKVLDEIPAHMRIDPAKIRPQLIERNFIAEGGSGEVYRGVLDDNQVAIKRLRLTQAASSNRAMENFQKEISFIYTYSRHPNILKFYGASLEATELFLVTKLATRGTLYQLIHANQLEKHYLLPFAAQIAAGMLYLHSQDKPVIHRDLKSLNILIDENWTVMLADFGISRLKDQTFIQTQSNFQGSLGWVAPEIIRGDRYDHKSDVYSFAIVLWEMITGKEPWQDEQLRISEFYTQVGHLGKRPGLPPPTDFESRTLCGLIKRCWSQNPADRPSFRQIYDELEEYAPAETKELSGHIIIAAEKRSESAPLPLATTSSSSSSSSSSAGNEPSSSSSSLGPRGSDFPEIAPIYQSQRSYALPTRGNGPNLALGGYNDFSDAED